MATLEHIRQEITELDCELLALLAKRKRLSLEVAKNKLLNNVQFAIQHGNKICWKHSYDKANR